MLITAAQLPARAGCGCWHRAPQHPGGARRAEPQLRQEVSLGMESGAEAVPLTPLSTAIACPHLETCSGLNTSQPPPGNEQCGGSGGTRRKRGNSSWRGSCSQAAPAHMACWEALQRPEETLGCSLGARPHSTRQNVCKKAQSPN